MLSGIKTAERDPELKIMLQPARSQLSSPLGTLSLPPSLSLSLSMHTRQIYNYIHFYHELYNHEFLHWIIKLHETCMPIITIMHISCWHHNATGLEH